MKRLITSIILLFSVTIFAQSPGDFIKKTDAFLKANVSNGRVNYKAIKNNPTSLNELIALGKDVRVSTSNVATYQAFWINAYNIHVINAIVADYPTKSPLDIQGFFDKTKRTVGGKEIVLNDIENKLLRAKFPKEPRFHFVLVCAGLGCPPIIAEAYTPEKLESQLQRQTVIAVNNPNFIKVKGNKVQISQIFEWYKGDFTQEGNEVEYLNKYRKEAIPAKGKVSYYPYDWTLNEIK